MSFPALTSICTTAQPPSHLSRYQNQSQPISRNSNANLPLNRVDPIVSWTSSISRLCRSGRLIQAATQFTKMRLSGVEPNYITFLALISGCAYSPSQGKQFGPLIHAYARKLGLDTCNVMVGTAIVDMYAKCGDLDIARLCFDYLEVKNSVSWNTMIGGYMRSGLVEDAIQLFDEMPERNAVSWTVLIDGFVKKDLFEQGLECFREMQVSKVEPDYVTIVSVLSACANLGALGLGLWTHRYAMKREFQDNVKISNSLIDMYCRSGCVELARQVFNKMTNRSLVSWNSIIVGCAANGFAEEALEYFDMMQREGTMPNGVSFTGALTACSHAGLIDEGLKYFDIMKRTHKISPRIEHYGCLVDLYSRAGRLEDALSVIQSMPMKPNDIVLGSLLAACRIHGDVGLAERLTDSLVDLDPGVDSNYVLLSNTYAAVRKWDGANKVRKAMKALGIQKKPGCSSVEIGGSIHEFVAGDKSHMERKQIIEMLELLSSDLKLYWYVPKTMAMDIHENS